VPDVVVCDTRAEQDVVGRHAPYGGLEALRCRVPQRVLALVVLASVGREEAGGRKTIE